MLFIIYLKKIPYGLLIVKQGFVQFPLLLQNRCQIAVGRSKLWENL